MKGHICDKDSAIMYLEECLRHGIKDVGFVSLMKENKYCEDHFIDFRNLFKNQHIREIINLQEWNNKDAYRCKNYAYISNDHQDAVEFYSRHYCKLNNNENTTRSIIETTPCDKLAPNTCKSISIEESINNLKS